MWCTDCYASKIVSTQTWQEMIQEIQETFPYDVYMERILDHVFYDGQNSLWIKYNDTKTITRALLFNLNGTLNDMRKAKESTKTETKQAEKPAFGGYKNITLTDEQYEQFDVLLASGTVAGIETVTWLLEMGKVTFQDDYGKFVATLTAVHENKLWSISAFAGSFHESLLLLSFKIDLYPQWLTSESTTKKTRG
jgi:hypothetical protein